jgi:glycosyltransferase involved in cell wall biosynthesis
MMVANVKQYRQQFYPMLRAALEPDGVELTVIYSAPSATEATKGDNIDLPLPTGRRVPRLFFMQERLLLQIPGPAEILRADLIVIVQATGYLFNYPLLLLSALRLKRVAFWGHGWNHQGDPKSFSERMKRRLANATDWWLTHTHETKRYLESIGVSPGKITAVENAIDTRGFRDLLRSVSEEELAATRAALRIPNGSPIGLFCGSLYREKRLDYLLHAAAGIAEDISGFRLIIVGAGPQSDLVRRASEECEHIIYVGPAFGRERAVYFRMADVLLNPGLVGLGILDSFAAGLPIITTTDAKHSPEIAYLVDGENGLLVDGDSRAFAAAVSRTLRDTGLLRKMKQGAQAAADHYTIENMVANVKRGILQCLEIRALNSDP